MCSNLPANMIELDWLKRMFLTENEILFEKHDKHSEYFEFT